MIRLNDKDTGSGSCSWQAQARLLLQARAPVRLEQKWDGDKKVPVLRTRSWKQFFLELFVYGEKTSAIRRTYTAINERVKPNLPLHHTEPKYQNDVTQPDQNMMVVVENNDVLLCQLQEKAGLPDTPGKNPKSSPYRPHLSWGHWHIENWESAELLEHFKQVYISEINKSVGDDPGLAMPVVVPFFDKATEKPSSYGPAKIKHSISEENVAGLADAIKEVKRQWAEKGRLIKPVIRSVNTAVISMAAKEKISIHR
jgi:hypothetical protein